MIDDFIFSDPKNVPSIYSHISDYFSKVYDQHFSPLYNIFNVSIFHFFDQPNSLYLINLALFYSNCLLIFYFIYQISRNSTLAILTSSFFCIHPMSGEIVQHITENNILMSADLMLLGLMAFYKYQLQNNKLYYYFSILLLIPALMLQELFSMLYVFYVISLSMIWTKNSFGRTFKICIPYILIEFVYFILWCIFAGHRVYLIENIHRYNLNPWYFCANYFYLMLWYLSNLFVPKNIVLLYNTYPISAHIWFWNTCFLLFLSGLLVFIFYFKKSIECFAIVLFFLGFIIGIPGFATHPEMGFIFEPYWLYFSSIGFYLFIAIILLKIRDNINRWIFVVLIPVMFMFYFINTEKMNIISRTQLSYCENWLRLSPGNTMAEYILSSEYVEK